MASEMVAELVGMAVVGGQRTAALVLGMDDARDGEGGEGQRSGLVDQADESMSAAGSIAEDEEALPVTSPERQPMDM